MPKDSRRRHRNALPPGYRLHWYEIDSVLGQGGFGITYLARDTNLDQLVAIKEFLPQELVVREEDSSVQPVTDGHSDTFGWGLSRFLTEARTLARFRHPNIVLVHSVFEANHTAYMVMEYEHGRSLDDALKFRKLEGEQALRAVLYPLLEGLELMHGEGFIHRDIKPQNIFIRDDGSPVLLDFGSARLALGGQTRTLTTLVSPGYAPFEQYESGGESGRQGPWTDIYSLGATLYMAVTGRGPPDAMLRANALLDGRQDPLVPARVAAGPGFSPAFLYAIDSALGFQAAERPKSVMQWRHLLDATEAPDAGDATVVLAHAPPPSAPAYPDTAPHTGGAHTADTSHLPTRPDTRPPRREDTAPPTPPPAPVSRRGPMIALVFGLLLVGTGVWVANRYLADGSLPFISSPAPTIATAPAPAAPDAPARPPLREEETSESAVSQSQGGSAPPNDMAPPAPEPPVEPQTRPDAADAAPEEELDPVAAHIAELLGQAQRDLQAGRLVEPSSDNAFHRYRYVLDLEPDNREALAGVASIARALASRARAALASGDLAGAESWVSRAETVSPEAAAVTAVRERLAEATAAVSAARGVEQSRIDSQARAAGAAQAREEADAESRREAEEAAARQRAEAAAQARREAEARQRAEEQARRQAEAEARRLAAAEAARAAAETPVERLLTAAEADLRATRLTSPAGRNALEKYEEVLRLEPGNAAALAGKERIVGRYVELAERAADAGRERQAESFLERAGTVVPGSAAVAAARERLLPPAVAPAASTTSRAATAPEPSPAPPAQPWQPPAQSSQPPAQPPVTAAPAPPALRFPALVAIMPVETKRNCFEPDDRWVRNAAVRAIAGNPALTVAYDAYEDGGWRRMGDTVWTGPITQRVPNADGVRRVAQRLNANVVFMARIDCSHRPAGNKDLFPYNYWAFDVDTGETLVDEGRLSDIVTAAQRFFSAVAGARAANAGS